MASGCESVGASLGLAVDSDPNTDMVPDTCCPQCHARPAEHLFPAGGQLVCCEIFRRYNQSMMGKPT